MAQPDLIAQKILATDPNVGFGESAVLPYRPIENRAATEITRQNERKAIAKAAREQDNEDYLNQSIGKLAEHDRAFDQHMTRQRENLIKIATSKAREGVNLKTDPDFQEAYTRFQQDAFATKQIRAEREKALAMTQEQAGKYINLPSAKGSMLKKMDEVAMEVNGGNRDALQQSIAANLADPEHFKFDQFIHDKTAEIGKYETAKDDVINGGQGQFVRHTEKGYKFYTHDSEGNTVPGIDKSVIDKFLTVPTSDPDMIQFRDAMDGLYEKHVENKALFLKSNDPTYKNIGVTRIEEMISSDPKNKNYVNKDAYQEKVLRQKLEPEQSITEKEGLRTSHKYPSKSGSGSGDKDKVEIVKTYDQTRNTSVDKGGVSSIQPGWVPEEWRLGGKKAEVFFPVNTTKVFDEKTNHELSPESTTGDKTFKATRMMLVPYNKKNNKFVHGDKDKVLNQSEIGYKWVVGGILKNGKTEKAVTIPYTEIQPDIKAKFGIDLDERAISEVSNYELIDQINSQYPDLNPEQKAGIFKKLRGE